MTFFFVKDLGLALAPKMRPDRSQTFKEVNNGYPGRHLLLEEKKMSHFFCGPAASRCSKVLCLTECRAKFRRTDCVGPILSIKSNLTPEIEYILNPSNCDAKP